MANIELKTDIDQAVEQMGLRAESDTRNIDPATGEAMQVLVDAQTGLAVNAQTADKWYTNLFSKVVVQELAAQASNGGLQFGEVFKTENWTNGLKEIIYKGKTGIRTRTKDITIGDFNPADPKTFTEVFKVTKDLISSIKKPSTPSLISAFTSPTTLSAFLADIVSQIMIVFKEQWQDEKMAILAGSHTAEINPRHDKVAFISDTLTTPEVLELATEELLRLSTASAKVLALDEPTIRYNKAADGLVLIWNSKFKSEVATFQALNFNPEALVPNLTSVVADFTAIDGIDAGLAEGIKFIIVDKAKLSVGFQYTGIVNVVKTVLNQTITEKLELYGYGTNATAYSSIWLAEGSASGDDLTALTSVKNITDNAGNVIATLTPKVFTYTA